MKLGRLAVVVAVGVGAIGACRSGGGTGAAKCVEGQSSACACPGGGNGAQVCNSGGAYGPCSCEGPGLASAPSSATAPGADPRPCPADTKAAALLVAALNTTSKTSKVSVLKCVPGRFPDPGWAFVAWVGDVSSDESPAHLHYTVLRETGAIVADLNREATVHERNSGEETEIVRFQSSDLDGDGVEELIEENEYLRRGWVIGNLVVLRVENDRLVRKLHLRLSYNDGGMVPEGGVTSCKARWTLSEAGKGRMIVITGIEASGPDASTTCITGTARYELRGGAFVKS